VNGIIHESAENTNADEIPDYDNLGDDDDDDDDDEIQYSDRFGMYSCCHLSTHENEKEMLRLVKITALCHNSLLMRPT